jgi:hypothetical protein
MRAALSGADGVASVRVDVSQGGMIVATRTVQSSAGAGVPFGDAFFVLPPGLYQVLATPFDANGAPLTTCAPAQANAQVAAGVTTEVTLTIVCDGRGNGGLDVVVKTTAPPVITGLTLEPSKFTFTCAPIELAVTASDPQGEPLSFEWGIVASPTPTGPAEPVTQLVPSGRTATFFTDLAGDYTLRVVVTNTDGRVASLVFPIHVVAGDPTTCNPRFDTLNHWSPPGPPVDSLTYGSRVHIFPAPGLVLPDPICDPTAHGGPVLPSPMVRPVLWGAGVSPSFSGPITSLMTSLFTDPMFAGYLHVVSQYTGTATSGSVAAPVTISPMNQATKLSDTDIEHELALQIKKGALPHMVGGDYYLVLLPPNITAPLSGIGDSCSAICSYHGSFQVDGVDAAFAVIPDCGPGACAVAGSHELVDVMTDPLIGFVGPGPGDDLGWYDDEQPPCNGEIADVCGGHDYALGGFQVAAAWSNQFQICEQVALDPTCGALGQPCCSSEVCTQPGTGCDATVTCVACPPPAPAPTLLTQEEDKVGSNCFSDVNQSFFFGPSTCGPGVDRVSLKTTSVDVSSDTSCRAHWVTGAKNDCRVEVDFHLPSDCSKHADCLTQIFVNNGGTLPGTAVRAELNLTDGHTLNPTHSYVIGGMCDLGYDHPVTPPVPTVIKADPGQTCAANWLNTFDPLDCQLLVTYHLGDLTKQITCDTKLVEIANSTVVPVGCP